MNLQKRDVAMLPQCTTVYQPKSEHMPEDLMSFEVYLSLPTGRARHPDVPSGGWLALELGDVQDATVLDPDVVGQRLYVHVRLQRRSDNGKGFVELGEEDFDVTTDVLLLNVDEIKDLFHDFQDLNQPYLERLPGTQAQALILRHGGPTEVHMDLLDFFEGLGLVPEGAKGTGWLTDDVLSQARKLTGVPYRRITAYFQPQAIQLGRDIDIDGARDVDVTAAVLKLDLDAIHQLEDYRDAVGYLVDATQLGHDGPFTVRVVDSICEYFGVHDLLYIEQEDLEEARAEVQSLFADAVPTPLEIRVDAFDIVITVHPEGGTSITSSAHAEGEPEAMKYAVDAILSLVKLHAENGTNVNDSRYVQGLKHALENVWAQFASEGTRTSAPH